MGNPTPRLDLPGDPLRSAGLTTTRRIERLLITLLAVSLMALAILMLAEVLP